MTVEVQERAGITFMLSELLAGKGVQIKDMDMKTFQDKATKKKLASWEAELEVPVEVPIDEVKGLLKQAASKESFMVFELSGEKYE